MNTIVAPALERRRERRPCARRGPDFYAYPRLSPDGRASRGSVEPPEHAVGRQRALGRRRWRRTAPIASTPSASRAARASRSSSRVVAGRRALLRLRPHRLVEPLPLARMAGDEALTPMEAEFGGRSGSSACRPTASLDGGRSSPPTRETALAAGDGRYATTARVDRLRHPTPRSAISVVRTGEALFVARQRRHQPPPSCADRPRQPEHSPSLSARCDVNVDPRLHLRRRSPSNSPPRRAHRARLLYPPQNTDFAAPDGRAAAAARAEPRRPDRRHLDRAEPDHPVLDQPRLRRARRQLRRQHRLRARLPRPARDGRGASSTSTTASTARATSSTQGLVDRSADRHPRLERGRLHDARAR